VLRVTRYMIVYIFLCVMLGNKKFTPNVCLYVLVALYIPTTNDEEHMYDCIYM
jgi:hypothetical protein